MDNNAMSMFSTLLSNPEAINNIKGMLGNIGSGVETEKTSSDHTSENEGFNHQQPDLSFLNDFFSHSGNSELLRKVSNAYNVYSNDSSPGISLLEALSPYLSGRRAANLQKVKNVIRITNAFSEFNRK